MTHTRKYHAEGPVVLVSYPAEHGDQKFFIKTCDGPIEAAAEARRFQHHWDQLEAKIDQ